MLSSSFQHKQQDTIITNRSVTLQPVQLSRGLTMSCAQLCTQLWIATLVHLRALISHVHLRARKFKCLGTGVGTDAKLRMCGEELVGSLTLCCMSMSPVVGIADNYGCLERR